MIVIDRNNRTAVNVHTMAIDQVDPHHQVEVIEVEMNTDLLATMTPTMVEIDTVQDPPFQAHNVAAIETEAQVPELVKQMKISYFKFPSARQQWFPTFKLF